MLGIDERRADVASSYPEQGYAGCSPGDCSGCLDVHREECEVRSGCAELAGQSDCAGCVCESCTEQLVECRSSEGGCAEIWECLRETRCELSERAAGNCVEACGAVIQANGGLSGAGFRSALAVRTCAASSACLTCLAPQVQQSARSCTQQNGCQDCADCFGQCLCSGERFSVCQSACGDQAPAPECSEDNGCAQCSNCFDACACSGESFQQCNVLCSPPDDPGPEPVCSAENSCTDCADCTSQCVCSGGGDEAACAILCGPPALEDACEFDTNTGHELCGGCNSCVAKCTCEGRELSECMAECGHHGCCASNSCPLGGATGCTCGSSGQTCFDAVYGSCDSFKGCDSCACQQCPGQLAVCEDVPGCKGVFDCMRLTECHGSACLERCGKDAAPAAFAFAEALWACYHGSSCSCETESDTINCPSAGGTVSCASYESRSVELPACCTQHGGSGQAEAEVGGNEDPCGLELSREFRGARSCEPREQPNPPRFELLETCDSLAVGGAVYNGATLRGCCRAADGNCGLYDDITGLGCLDATIFGVTPKACR